MRNNDIAKILHEIGERLAVEKDHFRSRAFKNAAERIFSLEKPLADIYADEGMDGLTALSGIGKGIGQQIEELLTSGVSSMHKELVWEMPVEMSELTAIEGVGTSTVKRLFDELDVRTVDDLEKAAREGKIRKITGFGQKKEQKILDGIAFYRSSGGRQVLGFVAPLIEAISERLRALPGVRMVEVAGSARRMREMVGDIDIVLVADDPDAVMAYVVAMPEVREVKAHGPTKTSVGLSTGLDLDVRIVPEESFGAALQYFTGSKEHNVALRVRAKKRGYTLNEYGLQKKDKQVAGRTEKEVYQALGLAYIPPELRQGGDEIERAADGLLPGLIEYDGLRGDLQVQTDWSDGKHSIEQMVEAAQEQGLDYLLVTDHTKRLTVANGLDEKRLREQMSAIDALQQKLGDSFRVLKGSECDILEDGSMDISDEVLAELDVVGGSIHSKFGLSRDAQTQRIIRAMENPHVDIIFHPTGRVLRRRPAYDVDMDAVIAAAKRTGTVLEIDAFPDRLDINDEYIRACLEAGVLMSISSDAHATAHFAYLRYGIGQARRAGAGPDAIINTRSWQEMLRQLK